MTLYQLLTLLLGASHLLNDGEGGVEVQPPQDVAYVEGIHVAIAIEVIDRERKVRPWNIGKRFSNTKKETNEREI
jgi:hypothetical protein